MDIKNKVVALIPFYADHNSIDYGTKGSQLLETVQKVRQYADKTVVVFDGPYKDPAKMLNCDLMLILSQHYGKAEAVRAGLRAILSQSWNPRYVIQIDADGDYPAENIPQLLKKTIRMNHDAQAPILIIGDRYPKDSSKIIEYRRNILVLQELFCESLGFKIRDIVAGLRVYNLSYIEHFLTLSQSQGFGLELEQLLIAHHVGAIVAAVYLKGCRPRDELTLTRKLITNFMVVFNFSPDLQKKGLGKIIKLFQNIIAEMEAGSKAFAIDLSIFGKNGNMYFEKLGDRYTIHSSL